MLTIDNSSAGQTVDSNELLSRANTYLQENDLEAARPLLVKLCDLPQKTAGPFLVAGLVHTQLQHFTAAADYFRRAVEMEPANEDARYNLALVLLATGDYAEARREFARVLVARPNDAGLHNDIGVTWYEEQRFARALVCFRRALSRDPNNSQARNNAMQLCLECGYRLTAERLLNHNKQADGVSDQALAEIARWQEIFAGVTQDKPKTQMTVRRGAETKPQAAVITPIKERPRLALFANHRTFIEPIAGYLETDFNIRWYDPSRPGAMTELLTWADIAWFEWCDDLVIAATKLPKTCRMVCRLHSYEAFTDMPSQVDWAKIDLLIFVNRSVQELTATRIPANVKQVVISNGVDLRRFEIPAGKQRSHKIASVGYINYKKNPALLLYCFKKIHEYDPSYSLHIAGTHQDSRIALYFEHFLKRHPLPVYFDGWVEDMPSWYADKGYVISTSLFESFHYSVAEGMASGLLPLIHDWYGADYL
ncbi:MAG: glycosyltransferase, partial [Candidatus Zixiibacteriota bacterium]